MQTCPDCTYVERQIENDSRFEIIDIGGHVKNLKAFLSLRDASPVFAEAKIKGSVGIPCFVLEDGHISLDPSEAGLQSRPDGLACSLDDRRGC